MNHAFSPFLAENQKTDDLPKITPYGYRNEQDKQERGIDGKQSSLRISSLRIVSAPFKM
jgi:hypothetical protein